MLTFRRPTPEQVAAHLASATSLPLTYEPDGGRWAQPPRGFVVDHIRHPIGQGRDVFEAGCLALRSWTMFDLGWVEAIPNDLPIEPGAVVTVQAKVGPFWSLNPSRIVEVIDESSELRRRFGFSYATLPGHAERGQERFLIDWILADDSVWYDVLAYSRPQHPLARLGYPVARLTQRRFRRDTTSAMTRKINSLLKSKSSA